MITQSQVIGNQERKDAGLVMKTSYTKKGLKTQPPGTLSSKLAEKATERRCTSSWDCGTETSPLQCLELKQVLQLLRRKCQNYRVMQGL